jgi:hypothetical protein
MRNVITLLVSILLAALGGLALCALAGWNPRLMAMALAAGAAVVAGGLAFVPLVLARGSSQAAVAQAALLGTVIHLMGCLAGAAVMLLVVRIPAATYWMLAFYWATLVALVIGFTRAVKSAPVTAGGTAAGHGTSTPKP